MKYRKKPVVIEAIQATGTPESNREIIDWTRGSATPASMDEHPERGKTLSIATLEGAHWVSPGDWIIKGVKGESYPCKPDIFAATYEAADAPTNEAKAYMLLERACDMLRDDRILDLAEIHCDLDTDSRGRKSFEFDNHGVVAFARAVEQAAYEAAIKACMEERVDADATQSDEDEAYNLACVHCSEAIRSLMQEQPK